MVGSTDALLSGISTEAAKMADATTTVGITDNWYFIIASTFLITILGTIVTEFIVEPKLGKYKGYVTETLADLTAEQKRGLRFAGIALVLFLIGMALLVVPESGVLRNPETGEILTSPFMSSIVVIISLLFLIPGIAYGIWC